MLTGREKHGEYMTGRDRVAAAVEHRPADRYPLDLGMHFSSGISAFAYRDLRRYLGLPEEDVEVADTVQMLARVDEDILGRFHCDAVLLRPPLVRRRRWEPRPGYAFWIPEAMNPEREGDEWYVRRDGQSMRMPAESYFFDGAWLQINEYEGEEFLRQTAGEAERLYKETSYFTSFLSFPGYFDGIDFACDMYTDPHKAKAHNQAQHEGNLTMVRDLIRLCGGYLGGVVLSADLGTQTAPMVSPDLYADLCAPFLADFCRYVHDNSPIKVQLHTCGAVEPFIPILIECGVDILNPVQISAAGMDPARLKARYGDRICFWGGGCDTQRVLGTGTPEEVRQNVRELTAVFKPGGGFVFNPVHNIMGNVPPENIVAAYEAAYENSFYDGAGCT